ncbi:MAG: 2-hydroxyglutaryl-CoA dehydratase [Deltaproteobacteria bacterium]|nr:2-hydroxyglutaryl-CoA dehydratase [Deltaproteobacteria bacterium]
MSRESTELRVGVDAGSTTWKAVAIDGEDRVVAVRIEPSEPRVDEQTRRGLEDMLRPFGGARPQAIGATGYGRKRVPDATSRVTEIAAHAAGAARLVPSAGFVLDVGGQDAKAIRLGPGGRALEFAMNDRCAAGTGRFLENALARLKLGWDDLDHTVRAAVRPARISSTCAVFAETEIVGLLADGVPVPDVVRGLVDSLAERLAALVSQVRPDGPVTATGGLARAAALLEAVASRIGQPVRPAPDPQLAGALGAAVLAGRSPGPV